MSDQEPSDSAPAKKSAARKTTARKTTAAKKATAKKTTAEKDRFPRAPGDVDRPWLGAYPPLVPQSYPYPEVALTRLLDDAAKDFPDSVAADFLGRTLTYRRVLDHVDRFATALQSLGVKKGDRVGVAMPNCPQHLIAFFGALRVGAIVAEIDPGLDEHELQERINDAGCRVLVVLDPVYAKVERLKGRVPSVEHVVGTAVVDYLTPPAAAAWHVRHRRDKRLRHKIPPTEGVLRFNELVRRHPPTAAQAAVDPGEDVALLAYPTGGSRTDRGVMLTHRNLLANVFQIRLWVPDVQAGRETILCAVPFWTPFGIVAGLGLGVLSAAALTLVPSTDRGETLATITKRKPTLLPATAGMIEDLVSTPHLRKHDLSSIRAGLCDSAHLAGDITSAFEQATGSRLREGLSLPEATAMTHANPVYGKAKAERVGLPLSDTVCVLVDPQDPTRLAGEGAAGELAVHGPQVMKGYWERPRETAAVLAGGWLRTGRLAQVDEEGYYCILGEVERR